MPRGLPGTPPVWAAAARTAYLEGTPVSQLEKAYGVSASTLYGWIDRIITEDGHYSEAPVPRRRPFAGAAGGVSRASRATLVRRLWRAADAQMSQLERRIAALDPAAPPGDAEAKALGLIARIVRELVALDLAATPKPTGEDRDDDRPLTSAERGREDARIAQLRADIARRLAGADEGTEAGVSGRDIASDDGTDGA